MGNCCTISGSTPWAKLRPPINTNYAGPFGAGLQSEPDSRPEGRVPVQTGAFANTRDRARIAQKLVLLRYFTVTLDLHTFGTVDLRSPSGSELRAVLQQPKRLALLVYLAIGKPGKLVRRDTLLALFWPGLDQEHARAALRRALYFLRQTCGADLIVGRGDEEVGIAADRLVCDANRFDAAIDANDLATALAIYQGGFLDGFYVQGAPEAEAWLDRERTRRRYEAALAAWQLARQALPDAVAAGRFAQRAIDLAPHDEDAIIAYLRELERVGERALALRLYEQAIERLATDLGTTPDRELVELGNRIRTAGAPKPAADPRRDEWLVAVCPFTVRGDPALAYLGEGMAALVSTKLDGTGAMRTTDPATVVKLAGPSTTGTDVETGRRIAEQLGAGFFLIGAVFESGGRLEAGVGLYESNGRLRTRVEGRSETEAGLFDLVDELVRRLMADFDQTAAGRLARVGALTTTSLSALKHYLAGEHEFRKGRHLQALDAFRRATGEDRSFALAYYRLASSLAANALIGPARQASADAYRHRERLSDHDRLLLEAQHAWLHGHTGDAERRYAALTVAFPEQVEPWFLLGDLLFHTNPYRGRSISEAREPFERALAIDEGHFGALTQLARLAALEGRTDDLNGLIERALRQSPSADQAIGLRVLAAFATGDAERQAAVTDELARAPGLVTARAFADVALYARDLAGAKRLGLAILPSARSAEFSALGDIVMAHLQLALGETAEAHERLRSAARHEPAWSLETRGLFAALPFGPTEAAERASVTAELEAWDPGTARPSVAVPLVFHDGLHGHFRLYLLGLLAARRGDVAELQRRGAELSELSVPHGAEVLAEQLARTLDAESYRLLDRPADALAALERLQTDVWFQFAVASPFYAGSYHRFLRAELLAELGRPEEAVRWWRTVAQRSPYEVIFHQEAATRADRLPSSTSR